MLLFMRLKCFNALCLPLALCFCPPLAAGPASVPETVSASDGAQPSELAAMPRSGTFSLEQILASPFASELTGSPSGGHVAWISYDRGMRNIWVASHPDYRPRQLTIYEADDGQEIRQLTFTPGGGAILYVRGGSANPLSSRDSEKQAIWIVNINGGNARRLSEGNTPTIAHRGEQVAFLRRGEVWMVTLEGDAPAERLFDVRGRASSLRWSPDGSQLAFVSERGGFSFGNSFYSFIGVYDLVRERIIWLDPSVYSDHSPVWSPDGRQVAFVRMRPTLTHRTGFSRQHDLEPWSIRVADVVTGRGREIFRALPGRGNVFWPIRAENSILWAADDQLVFPWEREGWLHLYSISTTGGTPILLTPGDFEVEQAILNPRRNAVIFSSNEGDIDRRHIWRVPVVGGRRHLLTPGAGTESNPVAMSVGDVLMLIRSDSRRPARPAMIRDGEAPRDLLPAADQPDALAKLVVDPQPVQLTAADGFKTRGQLFLPIIPRKKQPAVIFLHGGPQTQQQLLGWWFHWRVHNHLDYALIQYLTSRGYVVMSLNYRSGAGYGLDFREAPEHGTSGASEYKDVLAAAEYLRNRPDIDPARIALWGFSWGGYLTALGLARNSDLFAAGVVFYGPYDWVRMWSGAAIPVTSNEVEKQRIRELALRSSPIASVDTWKSPVLIIHGGDDQSVDFEQAVMLAEDLNGRDVEVEVLVYPDEPHNFLVHRHVLEAYQTGADFLDRTLHVTAQAPDNGVRH